MPEGVTAQQCQLRSQLVTAEHLSNLRASPEFQVPVGLLGRARELVLPMGLFSRQAGPQNMPVTSQQTSVNTVMCSEQYTLLLYSNVEPTRCNTSHMIRRSQR